MSRTAIVLFNLGGPDGLDAVEPFLFNLFNDPAIISLPNPLRWLLAKLVSRRRAPIAKEIYGQLGGASPLLPNTQAQARDLESALSDLGEVGVFIAMRYWHPMTPECLESVRAFAPDRLVLLPLYPQFSTTTTGSSLTAWHRAAQSAGLNCPTVTVCCYPDDAGFVHAAAEAIRPFLERAAGDGPPRLLFSAHGLPKKVVAGGDPYQWQVERSAAAVALSLGQRDEDWRVCYQSRVGPLEWIGPSTDDEIERAGRDGVPIVLFPIAFVSEHSETLVELDIEYRELAERSGVPAYHRVPTVGSDPRFIGGLAELVRDALAREPGALCSNRGTRICPAACSRCLCQAG